MKFLVLGYMDGPGTLLPLFFRYQLKGHFRRQAGLPPTNNFKLGSLVAVYWNSIIVLNIILHLCDYIMPVFPMEGIRALTFFIPGIDIQYRLTAPMSERLF